METHNLIILKKSQMFAFSLCSPVAYVAGWTSPQIKEALDIMNSHGIKGDKAGTTLRFILVRLLQPPECLEPILKKYDLSYEDVDPRQNDFPEMLENLRVLSFREIIYIFGLQVGVDVLKVLYRKTDY
ncbi:MAG TPA: hypothetical protein DF296_13205 [Candidatus Margulisbacteria bacterium]|nr:hypothetical protein [Candidatus Margulisiibacteriota bacterium]